VWVLFDVIDSVIGVGIHCYIAWGEAILKEQVKKRSFFLL